MSQILCGDCLSILPTLPERSVHCCVTSPPYWGLRDYGVDGQLGLEKTPEEYVAKMVAVFQGVKRVLRDDGCMFLNIGDSYSMGEAPDRRVRDGYNDGRKNRESRFSVGAPSLKPKDLCGIPWMLAFALRAEGWYLRQDIIWHKPNPMPESVTDRCTKAHEYIFLLSKSKNYYMDMDAIRETTGDEADWQDYEQGDGHKMPSGNLAEGVNAGFGKKHDCMTHPLGRNKRSVWTIPTHSYPSAHFATFPPKLVEPCILAGTSEKGCCPECGKPWVRVVERAPMEIDRSSRGEELGKYGKTAASGTMTKPASSETTGWEPGCECYIDDPNLPPNSDNLDSPMPCKPIPCLVLDPFMGAGTMAKVAAGLGRDYIGIELNPEYAEMARQRVHGPLFAGQEGIQ